MDGEKDARKKTWREKEREISSERKATVAWWEVGVAVELAINQNEFRR